MDNSDLLPPEGKPIDAPAICAELAARADCEQDRWERLALLLRALADDPGAPAVLSLFQLEGGPAVHIYLSSPDRRAAEVRDVLGRAIRKIMAEGGPEITDPRYLLSMLTSGFGPEHRDIPSFKNGEPQLRTAA